MIKKISFKGLYDTNLDNYTPHAVKQFHERKFKGKWVERVIMDPNKNGAHLIHFEDHKKLIHLGVSGPGDELIAVITNTKGKVVTLFKDEIVSRLKLLQQHYPNIDLFEMLKVKKP